MQVFRCWDGLQTRPLTSTAPAIDHSEDDIWLMLQAGARHRDPRAEQELACGQSITELDLRVEAGEILAFSRTVL